MPEDLVLDRCFVRAVCLLREQYLFARHLNPGAFPDYGDVPVGVLFNPNPYSPGSLDFLHLADGRLTVAEYYAACPEEFPVIRGFSSDDSLYFLLERYPRTRRYVPDARYVPVDCWNTAEEPVTDSIGQLIVYHLRQAKTQVVASVGV